MADKAEKAFVVPGVEGLFGQLLEEGSKLQAKWFEASTHQLDESAELAKTSLKYVNEVSAEWRRISMDSTRKAFDLFAR